jgi:hypothetical protein
VTLGQLVPGGHRPARAENPPEGCAGGRLLPFTNRETLPTPETTYQEAVSPSTNVYQFRLSGSACWPTPCSLTFSCSRARSAWWGCLSCVVDVGHTDRDLARWDARGLGGPLVLRLSSLMSSRFMARAAASVSVSSWRSVSSWVMRSCWR